MDNGLDIEERRCVLAFHAAAPDNQAKPIKFARESVRARVSGTSLKATSHALDRQARNLDSALDWSSADRGLNWAAEQNRTIITIFDPDYPALLSEIAAPPVVLYIEGSLPAIRDPQIAIVGSHKASHFGIDIAFRMARDLCGYGFAITSGMAAGIDAAAHRGALDAGGRTVAVFGCGIDRIYPARHRKLAENIAISGAVVSEFPLGSPPRPYHFPPRNRIISGLSYGTLVVEAALKSGSIGTAMHALEQCREVFAILGSIRNPMAAGCHRLIKQGATLVDGIEDIVEQMSQVMPGLSPTRDLVATIKPQSNQPSNASDNLAERRILTACEFESASFDELVERSGLTPTEVSSILSALEVRGLVRSLAGNNYLNLAR